MNPTHDDVKPANADAPASIGGATMEKDGTLTLQLRAEGPGGIVGDAVIVYGPTHADYAMVRAHLEANGGPMKPGDKRHVPPFPD